MPVRLIGNQAFEVYKIKRWMNIYLKFMADGMFLVFRFLTLMSSSVMYACVHTATVKIGI